MYDCLFVGGKRREVVRRGRTDALRISYVSSRFMPCYSLSFEFGCYDEVCGGCLYALLFLESRVIYVF